MSTTADLSTVAEVWNRATAGAISAEVQETLVDLENVSGTNRKTGDPTENIY